MIKLKKVHLTRFANQNGAIGESESVESQINWLPRPKGVQLKNLLTVLENNGIYIKGSSFDALSIHENVNIDFNNKESIENSLDDITFIEIKTANQDRVKEDFSGFFFALTESEIHAAEILGNKYIVAFFNKKTSEILLTSVPEIIRRSKSMT